jgi:uncharacterized protein (TIGR00369 family)
MDMTKQLADDAVDDGWGARRSRTVNWHELGPSMTKAVSMSGIDHLRAMMNGELPAPPFAELMQMKATVVEPGRVVFTCSPDDSMRNAAGVIHGGVACMVLDTVAGCALQTTLPSGKAFASVEIKVNYLKAILLKSGLLRAPGTVVESGSGVAFAECVMTDESGALVATASSTLLISDIKPGIKPA